MTYVGDKKFDLFTAYPSKSLLDSMYLTIQDGGLSGSQVIMRWI